jgi:hypothetical protein
MDQLAAAVGLEVLVLGAVLVVQVETVGLAVWL